MSISNDETGFDGVANPPGALVNRVAVSDVYVPDDVSASVVHELGHTFQLGDEYENPGGTFATNPNNRFTLESWENLQLRDDAIVGGQVDPQRLNWWVGRAAKASVVKRIVAAGPSTLVATIDGPAEKIWKQFEQVRLRSSFATPRRRGANNAIDPAIPRLREFEYEINFVSGSEVTLFAPNGGA